MAIQPIDLQTLYAQTEKVGKQQGADQQRAMNVQDAQQDENRLEARRQLNTVKMIEKESQDNLHINKDSKQDSNQKENQKKQENKSEDEMNTNATDEYIKDPNLGQRIDISG